jgi:phosphoribosyl 1,2-cyclic phosphodiesterase
MTVRFSMLASGSSGNACLIQAHGFGLLLDAGLGPRLLASRLSAIGANWSAVHAMILTHTHGDHWNDRSFHHLIKPQIPVYCHALHHPSLRQASLAFQELREAGLVRGYEEAQPLHLSTGMTCYPIPVRHDDAMTCGFRIEIAASAGSPAIAIGYAADLGTWQPELAAVLANVDVLGLEFNHDVHMQETSGRPALLIERVLGDRGHLSNVQAAALLREVLRRSRPGKLRHLVQLHLSRQCNRPGLAQKAAKAVLADMRADVQIHTAEQFNVGPSLELHNMVCAPAALAQVKKVPALHQPTLPGWE